MCLQGAERIRQGHAPVDKTTKSGYAMHSLKKGRAFQTDEKEQLISGNHRFP